ncbi:hypothetical protein DFQ26_005346 [Actinomortierella ambigua]|nr:hypothetical protein DFQ26_005346 [Actinomortierella ambigua]
MVTRATRWQGSKQASGTILKERFDLGFMEIKAPKDANVVRFYIEEKWALASLAKDTIDLHLREQQNIISIICLYFDHAQNLWIIQDAMVLGVSWGRDFGETNIVQPAASSPSFPVAVAMVATRST